MDSVKYFRLMRRHWKMLVILTVLGALGAGALAAFFGYAGVSILAYPVYNMMLGVCAAWIVIALMIPRLWDEPNAALGGGFHDDTKLFSMVL